MAEKPITRPLKQIDWQLVDNLLMAGCLGNEISPHFDMHPTTFYRRVEEHYGVSFTEYAQQKKSQGEACLRAQQYMKALGQTELGDNTLLIWLGKNRLNQSEKAETTFDAETVKAFGDIMKQITAKQSEN